MGTSSRKHNPCSANNNRRFSYIIRGVEATQYCIPTCSVLPSIHGSVSGTISTNESFLDTNKFTLSENENDIAQVSGSNPAVGMAGSDTLHIFLPFRLFGLPTSED